MSDLILAWMMVLGACAVFAMAVWDVSVPSWLRSLSFRERRTQLIRMVAVVIALVALRYLLVVPFGPGIPTNIYEQGLIAIVTLFSLYLFGDFVGRHVIRLRIFREGTDAQITTLMADLWLSSALVVTSFAMVYRLIGLNRPDDCVSAPVEGICQQISGGEAIYYSVVTFSTLGYGDFTPVAQARGAAAAEAVLGNLHLGMLVGLFVAAISVSRDPRPVNQGPVDQGQVADNPPARDRCPTCGSVHVGDEAG